MTLQEAMDLVDGLVRVVRYDPCGRETLDEYADVYWRIVDALRRVP